MKTEKQIRQFVETIKEIAEHLEKKGRYSEIARDKDAITLKVLDWVLKGEDEP